MARQYVWFVKLEWSFDGVFRCQILIESATSVDFTNRFIAINNLLIANKTLNPDKIDLIPSILLILFQYMIPNSQLSMYYTITKWTITTHVLWYKTTCVINQFLNVTWHLFSITGFNTWRQHYYRSCLHNILNNHQDTH